MKCSLIAVVLLSCYASLPLVAQQSAISEKNQPLTWHIPQDAEFVPNSVIVKFRESAANTLSKHSAGLPAAAPLLTRFGVHTMKQMFPKHESTWLAGGEEIALQRMYRIEYSEAVSPLEVARAFAALPGVQYAEPEIVQKLVYTPDDPRLGEQYALSLVEAEKAWDLTTGSEDIVIGIVDSGIKLDHEDLKDRIWVNPGEDIDQDGVYTEADIDSIDNDNNGYIDDIVGIDLVGPTLVMGGTYYDNDPDPTPRGHPHGTHVAGIAAASGDNGKGIAGLAYNCRVMAVKCGSDVYAPSILRGYDGIVYAADNGAHVINCSWGGGGYLESQKEMIDYAISKGAIVVVAAGNTGSESVHTPGAYPNVLCVANTKSDDKVNPSSTYGPWVDVSAPGTDILSSVITSESAYQKFTGTSMASPLVAGLAGLVRSAKPELSPEQVLEQIRVTSDPIDDIQLTYYKGKIGRGRINAYRALTESSPAVRLVEWSISDSLYGNGDGFPDQGEKLTVTMRWKNLLEPAQDATITLSTPSIRATVEQGSFHAGAIPTNGEVTNAGDPFIIQLEDFAVPNNRVDLIFTIEDGEYNDHGGVFFIQQPSYRDHDINDIRVTLTNDGNIGFDDLSGVLGSGLRYRESENVVFEGATMMGAIINQLPFVVDVARTGSQQQMEDFRGEELYRVYEPGVIAEQEGWGRYWDANAPLSYRLQTEVTLKSFAFTRPEAANMVFLHYTIHNYSTNLHEDFCAGLFFDWDIGSNSQTDIALYKDSLKLALCFDTTGRPRTPVAVGTVLLTPEHGNTYWGINNRDSDAEDRIGIYNGFTKEEKWKALSTGIVQPVSKITDVSQLLSIGPIDLPAGDSLIIGFALIAGESPLDVMNSVPTSLALWDTITRLYDPTPIGGMEERPSAFRLEGVSPQPAMLSQGSITVNISVQRDGWIHGELFDLNGRKLYSLFDHHAAPGRIQLPVMLPAVSAGTYLLRIRSSGEVQTLPIRLLR